MPPEQSTAGRSDLSPPSRTSDSPTPPASSGNAILFDLRAGTAQRLDLGNFGGADWIDDCNIVLAFDLRAGSQAVIDLHGKIIRTVVKIDTRTRGAQPSEFVIPYVVHDGRSLALIRYSRDPVTPTVELLDVFTGQTTNLASSPIVYPEFSPDGQSVAGIFFAEGDRLTPDQFVKGAVLARDCGDAAPYSCVEWRPALLESARSREVTRLARWSADGEYVFFRREPPCPTPPRPGYVCINHESRTVEVYSAVSHNRVLTKELPSPDSKVQWAGHNLAVDNGLNIGSARWQFIGLDGRSSPLPAPFNGQTWFSPDARYAINWLYDNHSSVECALLDVMTGRQIVSVPRPASDLGDAFCRHVSWTRDGSRALVTGGNDDRED